MEKNRLKWESTIEYRYRIATGEIIKDTAKLLSSLEKVKSQKIEKITIVDDFRKLQNKTKHLIVPEVYTLVNDYFYKCIENYYIASEYFVKSIKMQDAAFAIKSGRFVQKGNLFMELAKIEIYEKVEIKESEFNNKK